MSDGGRESGRVGDNVNRASTSGSSVEDFGHSISRIAVDQLCELAGFNGIQSSALSALSDVAIQYIFHLGKTSQFYANISGRTDSNVFDVIQGLEDLGVSYGFQGASDINHGLANSGVVRELMQYVSTAEELPFARNIPRYPISQDKNFTPSFVQIGDNTLPGNHIPRWLPAFPDPQTYIHTTILNNKASEQNGDKIELARQCRDVERSLFNLQQWSAGHNAVTPTQTQQGNIEKGKQPLIVQDNVNPFIAPPIPFGMREVSQLVSPYKTADQKTTLALKTTTPVLETVKCGTLVPGYGGNIALQSKRPRVHFKLGASKKSLTAPLLLGTKDSVESTSWLFNDDEKRDDERDDEKRDDEKWDGERDDERRKTKLLLKDSMESSQEIHHL